MTHTPPKETPANQRVAHSTITQTAQVLGAVLEFAYPADSTLSRHFRKNGILGRRDRAFIAETVYAVLRRLRWLHRLAGPNATPFQLLLAWLARGEGWPMRQFDGLVSSSERTWVEAVKAVKLDEGTLAEQADLPDWLSDRLVATYGEAGLLEIARGLNRPAPMDLRVNQLKASRDEVLSALSDGGIEAAITRLAPQGIRVNGNPNLSKVQAFLDGWIEVQDEGSQLVGLLVEPRRGELVIDFCAGAGGKTLQLGAMMHSAGRLYALDVVEKRLGILRTRIRRAGLSNVHPMLIAHERDARLKRLAGKADRVLVDAPCSGLGTLRRNPDLKWRQTPQAIDEMLVRQRAILEAAARLVRPGGRLVYATCSLLGEENDAVVDAFLAANPAFSAISSSDILARQGVTLQSSERLRLFPHQHDTDGFFAAVLSREG